MNVDIVTMDFENTQHVEGLLNVLTTYAQEDGGGGQSLSLETQRQLPTRLENFPTTEIQLALHGDRPVGALVAFIGFSTFKAMPVFGVHDLAVLPDYRGKGIGTSLLKAAERKARELGCCKLTLEVISNNEKARALYHRCGFRNPTSLGSTFFLERHL